MRETSVVALSTDGSSVGCGSGLLTVIVLPRTDLLAMLVRAFAWLRWAREPDVRPARFVREYLGVFVDAQVD